MRDDDGRTGTEHDAPDPSDASPQTTASDEAVDAEPDFDESLTDEIAALIDDGRTYAQAEIAFQKTRAKIAGKSIGLAIALIVVAVITLHIAVLALAVGMVIALQPLVTIWGAIAIVVGVLLLVTVLLALKAKGHASRLGSLFQSTDEA